jgi:hypothetical protein
MAYGVVNKTGCTVRKGNCQIRLDFFLEPTDPRYADKYLYLVDTTSPEYLAGYPGKVDEFGNPIDLEAYAKWWESLPRIWVNTPFHTHFIYLPATFTQKDIEDAIAFHLPNYYQAFQDRWDEVPGGMRHGWATETRIRPTNWAEKESLSAYDTRVAECQSAIDGLTEFSFKPEGTIEGQTFPATEIDIGAAASDRSGSALLYGFGSPYTQVEGSNPANDTGAIDYYEIWLAQATGTVDVWVGTFEDKGSNSLECIDSQSIGDLTVGYHSGDGLDIEVNLGDYFGACAKTGTSVSIEMDSSGYTHYWRYDGESIDDGDTNTFTQYSGAQISLYGTGETAGAAHYDRSGTALLGLLGSGSRGIGLSRADAALLGLTSTATRVLSYIRSDTALLGLTATASRAASYLRTKIALLGLKATASRGIAISRLKTALLGLKATGVKEVSAAWLGTWGKRVKISIDKDDIDSSLTWFPVTLILGTSVGINSEDVSFIFDELTSDANRKKIAVTQSDGTTQLYVEIEKWDHANKQAWLWVKAPSVSSTVDTDLYLYYDITQADNTNYVGDPESTPARAVWDSDYKVTYHMNDKTTSSVADSTSNAYTGTKKGANEPIEATGKVDTGQDFDGSNDYLRNTSTTILANQVTNATIEAWVRVDSAPASGVTQQVFALVTSPNGSTGYLGYIRYYNDGGTFKLRGSFSGSGATVADNTLTLTVDTWYHLVVVKAGTTITVYKDGAPLANTGTQGTAFDYTTESTGFTVGGNRLTPPTYPWNGMVDEVRVSATNRPAAWIKATYETSRDHLLDWGSEEIGSQHYERLGTALLGLLGVGARALVLGRTDAALLGLTGAASRGLAITRTNTSLLGLKGLYSKAVARLRTDTALLGLTSTASRGLSLGRTQTALLGLEGIGSRVLTLTKLDTALLGLKGLATRAVNYPKTNTALLGLTTTATKAIGLARSGTGLLGLLSSATRNIALSRAQTALLGLKGTGTRNVALTRIKTALLGLKALGSRSTGETKFPTSSVNSCIPPENAESWQNNGYITADDGNHAYIDVPQFDTDLISCRLRAYNFAFNLSSACTIVGIRVQIERHCDNGSAVDYRVQLVDENSALVGDNKAETETAWPGSDTVADYGGSGDMWGTSLTYDQINSANFGVVLSAKATDDNTDVHVDYIKITVYYLAGAYYERIGTALLGLLGAASRTIAVARTNTGLLGLKGTGTRNIAISRTQTALLGLKGLATRVVGYMRSGTALLGLLATGIHSTLAHIARVGTALLGLKATGTRGIALSRTGTGLLGLVSTGTRAISYTRVKTALLGLVGSATRTVNLSRTGTALLGLLGTATRTLSVLGRRLQIKVMTGQHRAIKALVRQYRKIKALTLGD